MSKKQSKKLNVVVNESQPSESKRHEEQPQLILSPFVHLFNIDESTKCLFNSLTLKESIFNQQKVRKDFSRSKLRESAAMASKS